MPDSLTASETLDRARSVMQSGRGAGLPELLQLIETLTTDLGKVTITEIAELIEKDAAVLARLLTVANTVYHKPNIAPLSSVHHAIHQVGFQRIRSLAVSLMLIENTGGARNPPEQREAAAQALCAGLLAQGAARFCGTLDPEAAFACAALRQFGHIILPAVSLDHYRAARERLQTKPPDIAWRGVFGLTPLELGRLLLAGSRRPLAPQILARSPPSRPPRPPPRPRRRRRSPGRTRWPAPPPSPLSRRRRSRPSIPGSPCSRWCATASKRTKPGCSSPGPVATAWRSPTGSATPGKNSSPPPPCGATNAPSSASASPGTRRSSSTTSAIPPSAPICRTGCAAPPTPRRARSCSCPRPPRAAHPASP